MLLGIEWFWVQIYNYDITLVNMSMSVLSLFVLSIAQKVLWVYYLTPYTAGWFLFFAIINLFQMKCNGIYPMYLLKTKWWNINIKIEGEIIYLNIPLPDH